MKYLINSVFIFFMVITAGIASAAEKPAKAAAASGPTPHQVVEDVTAKLMNAVKTGKDVLQTNPNKFYSDVESVLEEAVNFEFIARNVMGQYWKKATPEQQAEFVSAFKKSMVETYAKGMANFADLKIEVEPPKEEIPDSGKVNVIQKVSSADKVNRIAYTMARSRDPEAKWQLINVILDGVNLGLTFRSQFAQAVNAQKGDVAAAIKGWSTSG